jgi:hypothetical protein
VAALSARTLIAKALYPYPAGLTVATKGRLTRPGADRFVFHQLSVSLTRPDLSCVATFLPEDLTLTPLVLSLYGDRGFESLLRRVH